MTGEPRPPADDDEEPIALFGTWRRLYATVIVYTLGLVVLLAIASRLLDHSG